MKNSTLVTLLGSIFFTILFYSQCDGLNYLVFSTFIAGATLTIYPAMYKSRLWWLLSLCSVLSGAVMAYYGTNLAWITNMTTLLLLVGFSGSPHSSGFIALFHSLLSMPLTVVSFSKNLFSKTDEQKVFQLKRASLYILPILATIIFFYLYRTSDPLFAEITDRITINFPSLGQILFTGVGFYLLYGWFHPFLFQFILNTDGSAVNQLPLITEEEHRQTLWSEFVSLEAERKSALILFALLNLLLLSVNVIDVYYGFIAKLLPEGLTLSAYLHDGTNALIVSIIMAAALVLFVFRGYLNFDANANTIRSLVYVWIAQNIITVLTTLNRNLLYINEYGLTHRRIGVFIFLLLCVGGLVLTVVKVKCKLSNWFLLRSNWWMVYGFLLIGAMVNWDAIIFKHNMELSVLRNTEPDDYFLISLSHTATPAMLDMYMEMQKSGQNKFTKRMEHDLYYRIEQSMERVEYDEWPSQLLLNHVVLKKAREMKLFAEVS